MSDPGKAVFLSYASQDAEAAKRIADALRAAGVEVWFDTDGGLEHGDEWDAKIRRQIKECVLFLPIISANTQAREEGYFRLEWDLAAERARNIASGVAFILPVVIDGTSESEALVPDRFRSVQWTKLPGGAVSPEVLQRFLKLWSHRTGALKHQADVGASSRDGGNARGRGPDALLQNKKSGIEEWWWLIFPVFGMATGLFWMFRPSSPASRAAPEATAVAPAATMSEAPKLVAKVWEQLNRADLDRAQLESADGFARRATESDPNDADALAAWSQVDSWTVYHNFDATPARREAARTKAVQAMQRAPESYEARLAQACYLVRGQAGGDATLALYAGEAEKLLRMLLREKPDEPRALLALGILLRNTGAFPECRETFRRLSGNPAFAALAWNELGWAEYISRDMPAAEAAIDRSIALQPYWGNLTLKGIIAQWWRGDLDQALAVREQIPLSSRQEDNGVFQHVELHYYRRDPEAMLQLLKSVSRDWLQSNGYIGPVAYFAGLAHQLAGRTAAAQVQWQAALKVVERRLAENPDSGFLLHWKGWLLAASGRLDEAEPVLRLAGEMGGIAPSFLGTRTSDHVLFGRWEEAIAELEQWREARVPRFTAAMLRLNPRYDSLRSHPRFQALLTRMEADPRFSPKAARKSQIGASSSAKATEDVSGKAAPPDTKSVAVLAFANLSDDKANEYFSDGISEELLNVLAKVPGLKVSARTSAFYFKGKDTPIPEIAKQLGVAYVVEGSVRKQGNQVRITAQLIKASDGFHVWSENFTRDLKDIFAVQDEIAGLIAKNLELKMGINQAAPRQAVSPEAYQAYLVGRAAAAKAGHADLREAVTHFERAVAGEPKFTAAWVQLAKAHTQLGRWGGAPIQQSWASARAAIDRAVALEPDSPDVLLTLGWVRRNADWDWRGAERAFRRALELQPNQPDIMAGAAVLLFNIGKQEEAFRLGRQAAQLDPLNAATQIDLSLMFYFSGNWAEAEWAARRALQLAPDGTSYHGILGWSLMAQRRYDEAEAEIAREGDAVERGNASGQLAFARGQEAKAREILAQLEEIARTRPDSADLQTNIAWLSSRLGDKDRAFAALEKARVSRDPSMAWVRDNDLNPLHSDPRWPEMLRKMGLHDEQLK
jgi:TolB-like protein/Flp pilus assembly protein TadD